MFFFQDRSSRDTLLGWVRGVRLTEFIDRSSKGTYQGHAYNGADITPIKKLPKHVSQKFDKGCIVRWSEVADVSAHSKPKVTLSVGIEPTKPRFICDARYLSLMCKHSGLKMYRVGKVAQCSWQESREVSMDYK